MGDSLSYLENLSIIPMFHGSHSKHDTLFLFFNISVNLPLSIVNP